MKALIGGIMLAIGILIAGASGLCSLVFLISTITSRGGGEFGGLPLMVVVGGIPFAIGLGLCFAGRLLIRKDREDPSN